jgi:hypothetical protein
VPQGHNAVWSLVPQGHNAVWSLVPQGHNAVWSLVPQGHNDVWALVLQEHNDVWALVPQEHNDVWALVLQGHNDVWALVLQGHNDVWALVLQGHNDVWALVPQGHNDVSIILNRCKYDLVLPCAVTMNVKFWVIFIFMLSLSATTGKYSFVISLFVIWSQSLCHFSTLITLSSICTSYRVTIKEIDTFNVIKPVSVADTQFA